MIEKFILTVGGVSSVDYDIYALDSNDEESTSREYETVQVPGKNGDLHFDNGRYANIQRTYKCVCMQGAKRNVAAFVSALLAQTGYQRIEDTLNDEYYKMGVFTGNVAPRFSRTKDAARFDITFGCKPQKWLKIGERELTLASTDKVINPTYYSASPLLEITGNGQIGINAQTVTIAGSSDVIMLDLELGDAYSKSAHSNRNSCVTWTAKPVLRSGVNNITVASGMTVKLTPRWWFL